MRPRRHEIVFDGPSSTQFHMNLSLVWFRCMVPELINNEEYLWTGHTSGELCLWSEMGRLVGKPFTVAKTGITYALLPLKSFKNFLGQCVW